MLTPGYGCSRRSVSSPISSSSPWSPALYFDDGDLSFHRMSAIAFAVYSQRCYPKGYEAVHIEHPSQIRFYSQHYHFPFGLRVPTVLQFYFLRHRKAHVRPSLRLAKTHAFAKATCFFEALSSLLSHFTKVTWGFSGGRLAEHQFTSLYVELTYCKSSFIIPFSAGRGNKINPYKPLISVYPFAGLGAYVPSPGIRINRYFLSPSTLSSLSFLSAASQSTSLFSFSYSILLLPIHQCPSTTYLIFSIHSAFFHSINLLKILFPFSYIPLFHSSTYQNPFLFAWHLPALFLQRAQTDARRGKIFYLRPYSVVTFSETSR